MVPPYLQRFLLSEMYEHITAPEKAEATYWVVAVTNDNLL